MSEAAGSAPRTPDLVRTWSRALAASRRGWGAAAASVRRGSLWIGVDDLLTHPRAGTALVHGAALLVASVLIALGPQASSGRWLPGATLIAVGLSGLRIASVNRHLTLSTLVLDGVGTALLLASTGAPGSPFSFIALAGTWWATRVPGRSARDYVVPFTIAYAALVLPSVTEAGALMLAAEEVIIVLLVGVLAQRAARGSGVASDLAIDPATGLPGVGPTVADRGTAREGAAGGGSDWTPVDSELSTLLATGLTNREIAATMGVSESSVQRRLTRLYRALGVRRRRAAVARTKALRRDARNERPVDID